jgi:alpha-tubulin suppressor-like RCC1 family protein
VPLHSDPGLKKEKEITMKKHFTIFPVFAFLFLSIFFPVTSVLAQCNVNDKYDKIISGYHSSIALKDNGVYAVWGSFMNATGAADVLAPQDINVTNYSALTGTVLKAAMGGKNGASQVDQAIILTTTGLWAWGVAGNVVSTTVKTGAAFGRTSVVTANGFNTYGLPAALIPSDVASLFATYQTLLLMTTTGNVWILTQTTLAVEANGGAVATVGTSTWKQVKINSTTNLTNVTAVRGQVSGATLNAFIALTSTGQAYTWGNSTYAGDGTVSSAKNYATLMTIPAEFSSSVIPKMIGLTGGIGTTATTKNTYYLLSNAGNLYSLGDNTQRQCGDFTITERTSWVNVKINATTNFTNINFFSAQEHNSSYPGAVAITTAGDLYTWGNNSSSMLGRTSDGTATGAVSATCDPGLPVIFTSGTDKAISAELGGHTLVYLKEGTSQFCYVGHRTNGSMGDGTATTSTNGSYFASCSSTPSLNICGSVPVAGSTVSSTISASLSSIQADGASVSIITVQLKDAGGVNLTSSGGTVVVTTSNGTLGTVTDNNNGTYTVTLTSSSSPATTTLGFSINGTTASNTIQVVFVATSLPLSWINVQAYRQNKMVKITWATATEVNVKDFQIERSLNGNSWSIVIANIPASGLAGTNYYEQTDSAFNPKKLIYRIRQEDIDGRFTYSAMRVVPAVSDIDKITVYPVPADNSFHLGNSSPDKIKAVQLISVSGSLLKTWNQFQASYDIQEIPAGNYILRIETTSDIQILKLRKQ